MKKIKLMFSSLVLCVIVLTGCPDPKPPQQTTPPSNPSTFTATAISDSSIRLSWSKVEGASSYTLERKTGQGSYSQITAPTSPQTEHTDTGLRAGITYSYRIKASNKNGSSPGVETSATTQNKPSGKVPATPTEFKVVGSTTNSIELSWKAATGASEYLLERKKGSEPYAPVLTVTGTSYTDTSLNPATAYSYRLKAVNDDGASGSVEVQTTTAAPGPSEVIISKDARVATEAMRSALVSFDAATGVMRFNSAAAVKDIEVNNVVVSEPSAAAPSGYLRKVTAKKQEGTEIILETEPAALTDVVLQGVLNSSQAMEIDPTQSIALVSGVSLVSPTGNLEPLARRGCNKLGTGGININFDNTVIYQNPSPAVDVILNGCLRLEPEIFINHDIRFLADVHSLSVMLRVTEEAEIELDTALDVTIPDKEKEVYKVGGKPIKFTIGPIPVVITPKFTVKVGIKSGSVSVEAKYSVAQDFIAEVGVQYRKGQGFSPINNTTNPNFHASNPDPKNFKSLSAKAKVHVTAIPELKLYEAVSGELSIKAYADLDFQMPRDPVWIISAGGQLGIKLGFDVLGVKGGLDRKTDEIELWRNVAPNFAPVAPAILSPNEGTSIAAGEAVSVQAFSFDPEEGFINGQQGCERLVWSLDGVSTGVNACGTPSLVIPTQGSHTVSAVATDTKGLSSTTTFAFTVAPAKAVTILEPAEGADLTGLCGKDEAVNLKANFDGGTPDSAIWFQVLNTGAEEQIGTGLNTTFQSTVLKDGVAGPQTVKIKLVITKGGAESVDENNVSYACIG